jgi:N-acetylglucosaminyldiphosphoundecaprenol N-acetyl-beta-D-mannosaminyltransferase
VTELPRWLTAALQWTAPRGHCVEVLGLQLSTIDRAGVLDAVSNAVSSAERLDISFVNPDYATRAVRDPDLRDRMNSFDLLLPDGWGVVYAMRLRGARGVTRQATDDIAPDVFALAARNGWRTFLFGSAPGVADQAAKELTREFPGLPVVGTLHGFFDIHRGHAGWYEEDDVDRIVERINAARPDVLWVGIPTPMQQEFVTNNRDRIAAPVVITGGSYLDHLAHGLGWYPTWTYALRANWLWRLALEPRRLWRRYSLELGEYCWLVARDLLGGDAQVPIRLAQRSIPTSRRSPPFRCPPRRRSPRGGVQSRQQSSR